MNVIFFSLIVYEETITIILSRFLYNSDFILLNVFCKFAEMYIVIIEKKNAATKDADLLCNFFVLVLRVTLFIAFSLNSHF